MRRGRIAVRFAPADRGVIAAAIAWTALQIGCSGRGLPYADEAIDLACRLEDYSLRVRACALRAWLLLEIGRGVDAAEQAVAARELAEVAGDATAASWAFNVLGCVYWYSGQLRQGEECCRRAVQLAETGGDPVVLGWWLINRAGIHDQCGRDARRAGDAAEGAVKTAHARVLATEAFRLLGEAGDHWGMQLAALNMADDLLGTGEIDAAEGWVERLRTIPEPDGDRSRLQLLQVQGRLLLGRKRPGEALIVLEESLAISESCRNHDGILLSLDAVATAYEQLGRFEKACAMLRRRQSLAPSVIAEHVQERARLSEVLLNMRDLESKLEAAERRLQTAQTEVLLLAEESRRDPLTGIGNRRRFDEALGSLTAHQLYSVAMIDVDHFKSINDRFSHIAGDEVLRGLAQMLDAASRRGDLVVRLGGEEFALLLSGVGASDGARICRRLRLSIMRASYGSGVRPIRITASFGIADSTEALHAAGVLALADQRLYIAKRTGRNRVVARAQPMTAARFMPATGAANDEGDQRRVRIGPRIIVSS